MIVEATLYRGEAKTITLTLKKNEVAVPFSTLAEVTVIVAINKQKMAVYKKTNNTVVAVAGAGNENKCTIQLTASQTKYYPIGLLTLEVVLPVGADTEVEGAEVFMVKDSNYSRLF
jgi:hypothetical protein